MRGLAILGVVLIVAGIAGLIVPAITVTERDTVLDIGPVEIQKEDRHTLPIPAIAAVIAIVAGLALVISARRTA
jgi:ABC-type Fe3+ transport system permease subunit